jgi:chromosome partitioning related protein ParA
MKIPPVRIVVNNLDQTTDAQMIEQSVREIFQDNDEINVLECVVPSAVVFRNSSSLGVPVHRLEYRQPSNRISPAALVVIRQLAIELFPEWRDRFEAMTEEKVANLVREGR